MGAFISHPVDKKTIVLEPLSGALTAAVGWMQGHRMTMEDAHCLAHDASLHPAFTITILGVFDGHGGDQSSRYIATALPLLLVKRLLDRFRALLQQSEERAQIHSATELYCRLCRIEERFDYVGFLRDCYFELDEALLGEGFPCGSTAVVALCVNERLVVANVGDSRCYLSVNGVAKSLSFDHKPSTPSEFMRIQRSGGFVAMGRVNGLLALSRAFGDFGFKRSTIRVPSVSGARLTRLNIPPEEFVVSCEPEVITRTLDADRDEFVVLACDGIWDCYTNQALNDVIRSWMVKGKTLTEITKIVLDNCIQMADNKTGIGYDNMTLIIAALHLRHGGVEAWYDWMVEKLSKERGLV